MLLQQQQHFQGNHPADNKPFSDPIQATITHCLNNYSYADAIFLAERLFSLPIEDTPTSLQTNPDPTLTHSSRLFLLATTYYRSNDKLQCYELLKNHNKSVAMLNYKARFLLATVAWELGKPSTAESTLLICKTPHQNPLDTLEKNYSEIACFALKLYGTICSATERVGVAKEAYARALRLNPFLFNAFESLVKLGGGGNKENGREFVERVFQANHMSDSLISLNCHGILPDEPTKPIPIETNNKTGILMNRNNTRNNSNRCHRNLFTSTPNSHFFGSTPSPTTTPTGPTLPTPTTLPTPSSSHLDTPTTPISPIITMETAQSSCEPKSKKPCLRTVSSSPSSVGLLQTTQTSAQQTSVRRSSRLFGGTQMGQQMQSQQQQGGIGGNAVGVVGEQQMGEMVKEKNKQQALKENTKEQTGKLQRFKKSSNNNKLEIDRSGIETLLSNIRDLALASYHLTRYECKKAIETIATLKPSQASTPFAISTVARAQFEMGDYEAAVGTYSILRLTHPYSSSLTYLSSSLWHLSMETPLSLLSQEFLSEPQNKTMATTWLTLGNTFSLQKEHETAIKFFKRAIQIDPSNAYYAHVLLGHEYVATDELDKGLRCFRTASRIDGSQYNCWYGIGMVYYKQERFEEALFYYEKATRVNKSNCVLLCHLGVVQSALNQSEKSLQTFSLALKLNPNDPLCKFHRASVLFASGRFDEALEELEELKRIVPKESLVHFLIAKIHSKSGSTHKALLHFSWATDLDPKGANNHIKESIEPVLNNSEESSEQTGLLLEHIEEENL